MRLAGMSCWKRALTDRVFT